MAYQAVHPDGRSGVSFTHRKDCDCAGVIAAVAALPDQIGIPKSLGEIGVPEGCAARIAEKALKDGATLTNPRTATLDAVTTLTKAAIAKAR